MFPLQEFKKLASEVSFSMALQENSWQPREPWCISSIVLKVDTLNTPLSLLAKATKLLWALDRFLYSPLLPSHRFASPFLTL